ncbi:anti-silencing protein, ASF1 family protein [Cardiosporidium cionae]|uniref:Anti-silencing protein, ASF1 family protein n=1 Tax=Cardiosporidium cionae TaxID=476202 RepID=A0ABQ7J499_9APIC|nr:anti-silencing protein, ASF1 family protein [Cardiosporidium cionae]|eukprot:KAF8817898.1 anti-silencing protein, ASF1 family protein [Cardiosporidium cionae]
MACINVTRISVKNNPAPLMTPFNFHITFESLHELQEDVEWRIIYVGECNSLPDGSADEGLSGTSQPPGEIELDCVALGPIKRGVLSFEFAVKAPDFAQMDSESILGMQAVLVTASYKKQEFIRIGYFLNNTYMDSALRENPPYPPKLDQVARCIIADSPRVTRFPIHWDELNPDLTQPVQESEAGSLSVENGTKSGIFFKPAAEATSVILPKTGADITNNAMQINNAATIEMTENVDTQGGIMQNEEDVEMAV